MQDFLYNRISSERDEVIEKTRKLRVDMDTECRRRQIFNCIKEGAIDANGKTNKYILDGFEEANKNIALYEEKIADCLEKISALEYQMQYIEMSTNN